MKKVAIMIGRNNQHPDLPCRMDFFRRDDGSYLAVQGDWSKPIPTDALVRFLAWAAAGAPAFAESSLHLDCHFDSMELVVDDGVLEQQIHDLQAAR
jgi:hypothetical protein